jgi:hypothetical protein
MHQHRFASAAEKIGNLDPWSGLAGRPFACIGFAAAGHQQSPYLHAGSYCGMT